MRPRPWRRARLLALTSSLLLVGATAPAALGAGWIQGSYNAARINANPRETMLGAANVAQLQERWHTAIGEAGWYVYSYGAAISRGVVYASSTAGHTTGAARVSALDEATGSELWRAELPAPTYWSPALSRTRLFTAQYAAQGALLAFDRNGCGQPVCSPLWQGDIDSGYTYAPPLVYQGTVYLGGADDSGHARLWAFAAAGCGGPVCQPLWSADLGVNPDPDVWYTTAYLAAAKGQVFAAAPDGTLAAFAAAGCGQASCSPVWTGAGAPNAVDVLAANGRVLVVRGTITGSAVAAYPVAGCGQATCQPQWTADAPGVSNGYPSASGGSLYLATTEPNVSDDLSVFRIKGCGSRTCSRTWSASVPSPAVTDESATTTVANGVVYLGANQSGQLAAYPAAGCGQPTCSPLLQLALSPDLGTQWGMEVMDGLLFLSSSSTAEQAAYGLPTPLDAAVAPLLPEQAPVGAPAVRPSVRARR
jgi:outer membrane protein assembly factor BamB